MVRFYNTLAREIEEFRPGDPSAVRIYACGPTVYDFAHIGNFRTFVWVDLVRRFLEWRGFDVTLVMNLTDVDDKTIDGARAAGEDLDDYTRRYIDAFHEDCEALRMLPAHVYPRATEHVEGMAELVQRLLDGGHAYRSDGSIFFRVDSFPDYGALARVDPDELQATGRAEADAHLKEDPRDFTLWKGPREGEPSWDTAVGPGRPGWHLECSTMSMEYLGTEIDLHLGGVDLIFPHHENEIAQSVAATGEPFVRTWLHCAHLVVDGTKMSKSLGNQFTVRDLLERGIDPVVLRYLLLSVHYRKQLNFTEDALERSRSAVARLREFVLRAEQEIPGLPDEADGGLDDRLEESSRQFREALDDDLNTSGALGVLFSLVKDCNVALDRGEMGRRELRRIVDWVRDVDRIWAVLPGTEELVERSVEVGGETLTVMGPPVDEEVVELVVERMRARAERDFDTADEIRDRLRDRGIVLEDTPQGVRWQVTRETEAD